MRSAEGDPDGALKAYQDSLAIRENLAARDPGNVRWQVDLSEVQARLGNVHLSRADSDGRLAAYRKALVCLEVLASYGNLNSQHGLVALHAELTEVANLERLAVRAATEKYILALQILRELQRNARLAPAEAWMVEDLEARLERVSPRIPPQ